MKAYSVILFLCLISLTESFSQAVPYNTIPDSFYDKDSVKIIVTDSGLGGLSIAAHLLEEMKHNGLFSYADIVFFNAQPHINSGYNSMDSTNQKVMVFNNALNAMKINFDPDMILIGCNTLSVIYEYTDFSKTADIPVLGIVDAGVDLIYNNMKEDDNSEVIIFATKTTCNQAKHRKELINKGIDEGRITMIPCHKLAGNIERDSESRITDSLVTAFVHEAIITLQGDMDNVYVSYNCTHYGYIDNQFQEAFKKEGFQIKKYLNPNPDMVEKIFDDRFINRFDETKTNIKVVSQAELTPAKIGSIYLLIEPESEATAEALFDYQFEPEFFEWESVVN